MTELENDKFIHLLLFQRTIECKPDHTWTEMNEICTAGFCYDPPTVPAGMTSNYTSGPAYPVGTGVTITCTDPAQSVINPDPVISWRPEVLVCTGPLEWESYKGICTNAGRGKDITQAPPPLDWVEYQL